MTKWQKTALVAVGFKSDKDEADEQTDKRGKDGERERRGEVLGWRQGSVG